MKLQSFASTLAASVSVLTYTVTISNITHAQEATAATSVAPTTTFSCQEIDGVLHTVAKISQLPQEVIPIFIWSSDYYPETGEDALARCVGASAILQDYNQKGLLNYLETKIINGKSVVCAASAAPDENVADNSCSRPIFTFKSGEDAGPTVEILRQVLSNSSSQQQRRLRVSESEIRRQPSSSFQPKPSTTNGNRVSGCGGHFCAGAPDPSSAGGATR